MFKARIPLNRDFVANVNFVSIPFHSAVYHGQRRSVGESELVCGIPKRSRLWNGGRLYLHGPMVETACDSVKSVEAHQETMMHMKAHVYLGR